MATQSPTAPRIGLDTVIGGWYSGDGRGNATPQRLRVCGATFETLDVCLAGGVGGRFLCPARVRVVPVTSGHSVDYVLVRCTATPWSSLLGSSRPLWTHTPRVLSLTHDHSDEPRH